MKNKIILLLFLLLSIVMLGGCCIFQRLCIGRRPIQLKTASGIETAEFQLHDTIMFEAVNLARRAGYTIQIARKDGKIVTQSRLSTDRYGRIPETVLWYDIGILPCFERATSSTVSTHLSDYEISDVNRVAGNYTLRIIQDERLVREMPFSILQKISRPRLYASDRRGCPQSGFLIGEQDVWAVGKNFPKGSIIRLWAVPADSEWKDTDPLKDVTKQYDTELPPLFELKEDEDNFKKLLWPKGLTSIGSYDIVAETVTYPFGIYHPISTASVQDVVSNLSYSGFVVQRRQGLGEPLEQDLAGTRMSKLAMRDTFLTTENVYAGVDPYVQPNYIGQTADVYIVSDKTDAGWTTSTGLSDITGYVESVTIQPGTCANAYSRLAWAAPLTPGEYDVVLDFDTNGQYNHGTDLIDSLDPVGFTVAEVRVESISFNYSGSGAITIYDNINSTNISAPEYSCGPCESIQPAAWVMGSSCKVHVEFKGASSVSSAQIWAENGLGGLNSSGSPVTVSFSGVNGHGTFTVNNVPTSIGKHVFDWDWKYKNVNGVPSGDLAMGTTAGLTVYTVYSTPKAPMTTPWLEVLEYATDWAAGETSQAGVVAEITDGIYNSGMVYDGYSHHTTGMGNFNLTGVFNELRTGGLTVYMDCRDCANFFHVLSNALGFSHEYLRIPGPFTFEPIFPMGATSCNGGAWNYHQVGWCGSEVADGSAKVACNTLAICDLTAVQYIDLLTNTSGITAGSTGICSPY